MSAIEYALRIGVDILGTILGQNTDPTTGETTGTILAQTGNASQGVVDSDGAEWWQHVGLASRPGSSNGKTACQGVVIRGTDRDIVINSRDTRTNQIYGNLQPGETCLFAAGSDGTAQGREMIKADGSLTWYTTDDNTPTGNAVYARLHPTKGFTIVTPWFTFSIDQVGFRVQHQSGFSLFAGSIGGLPGPFAAMNSYVTISAGSVKMNGSQVYLGGGPVYYVAAGGLGSNPLTAPNVPIAPAGYSIPCGLFTTSVVHMSVT